MSPRAPARRPRLRVPGGGSEGLDAPSPNPSAMSTCVEVSRTLVKSPPELWEELRGDRLARAIEGATVRPTEEGRTLAWEAQGARGTAAIEPSGWGTKVTLTAEVEEQVARLGLWARLLGETPPEPPHHDVRAALEGLLDDLGSAHKKPFTRA